MINFALIYHLLCFILVLQKETGGSKEIRQPGEGSSRHIEENVCNTIRSSQDRGRQVSRQSYHC